MKSEESPPPATATKEVTGRYTPTAHEQALAKAYIQQRAANPTPRLKAKKNGAVNQILPDHPDLGIGSLLLMQAIGSDSFDFLHGLSSQLANAGSHGREPDESGMNFMLSVVKGVGPKDQVEAMLASQMAAVHMATMTFARRLAHVENIQQQDSAERAFN